MIVTQAPLAEEPHQGSPDHQDEYSDSSWKIAFLLQFPARSTILVDGSNRARLCVGLSRLSYRPIALPQATADDVRHASALVVLPGSESSPHLIERGIGAMNGDAQVLAFFRHRWSMWAGVRTGVRNLLSPRSRRMGRAAAISRNAHRAESVVWLPVPKLSVPEEFVALSESEEIAASLACTPPNAWLRARLHDGFGVYASPSSAGMHALNRRLEGALAEAGVSCKLRITRFDLRERGALVLFVMDDVSRRAFVCRIVRGEAAGHLERHWVLQAGVRRAVQARSVRFRIPEEIATMRLDEHTCWVESRAPGTVSWRLPASLRPRLDDQIVEFVSDLAAATMTTREVTDGDLMSEERLWCEQIGARLNGKPAELLAYAFQSLRDRLRGRRAGFGWVHGDYGYGNVLAAPHNGELCAVIDWETASAQSFVGIDLFNFLLQRARSRERTGLPTATARLAAMIDAGSIGGDFPAAAEFLHTYLPEKSRQHQVLALTLCRWIRREHRYTLSSPVDSEELCSALSYAIQACRASDGPPH